MKDEYCIYGANGHGKVIIEILEAMGSVVKELYDDDPGKKNLLGYKVNNNNKIFGQPSSCWIIGVGDNDTRKKIADDHALAYGAAIHPRAIISTRVEVGHGSVIMAGATVNSSTKIGSHVIVNTNSSIDHDCTIGDFVHISPNATLCGGVIVGEGTHIGAGATIIPGIKVGKWAKIGAGSVIIRDISDNTMVVGNPGKVIKHIKR